MDGDGEGMGLSGPEGVGSAVWLHRLEQGRPECPKRGPPGPAVLCVGPGLRGVALVPAVVTADTCPGLGNVCRRGGGLGVGVRGVRGAGGAGRSVWGRGRGAGPGAGGAAGAGRSPRRSSRSLEPR